MTYTLLGADLAGHFKIVAVATFVAIAIALGAMNAGVSESQAGAGRAQASGTVFKAGKPAVSAAVENKGDALSGPMMGGTSAAEGEL